MAQEIRPVVDVDQNVGQVDLRESRLDEFFENLDRIRFVGRFQGRKVEFALFGINRESFVLRNTPVDFRSNSVEASVQLQEIFICFGRQFEMGVMPGSFRRPE